MIAIAPYALMYAPDHHLRPAWRTSVYVSQLLLALLAGNIIACERADRSAEFLAFQGASRAMILTSKAIICLLAYVVICVVMVVTGKLILSPMAFPQSWQFQLSAAASGFALWGCCWLLSSYLESPVLAIILGTTGPMFVYGGLSALDLPWLEGDVSRVWYSAICIALGVATFVGGTIYYLKRKEP